MGQQMWLTRVVMFFLQLTTCLRSRRIASRSRLEKHGEPRSEEMDFRKAFDLSRDFCEALAAEEMLINPQIKGNGERDFETSGAVSEYLRENPFLFCEVGWNDLARLSGWRKSIIDAQDRLGEDEELPVLEFIGKQKKGGIFWKTPPPGEGFLMKSVKPEELAVLKKVFPFVAAEYRDCETFQSTLLQPVLFFFQEAATGDDYIVMRDETMRLQELIAGDWEVMKKWDIKPLPNLSDDLPQVIQALLAGVGVVSSKLHLWIGWESVRDALQASVNVLHQADVVDYSLFIHLLVPKRCLEETCERALPALGGHNRCMFQHEGEIINLIICVKIIDYLTPYTVKRGIESFGKGDKFYQYANKFMTAFDCIGDVQDPKCVDYAAYASVKLSDGTSDTPNVAFLKSALFASTYACQVDYPRMRWLSPMPNGVSTFNRPCTLCVPTVQLKSDTNRYQRHLAESLQDAAATSSVVKARFRDYLRDAHERLKETAMEEVGAIHPMPITKVTSCEDGIKKFATESWFFKGDTNVDLQNVIWNPHTQDIFVVRGKPKFSSHSQVLIDMRLNECFLDTRLHRCSPAESWTVQTNYSTTFGGLEILQVRSGHYSREFAAWARAKFANKIGLMADAQNDSQHSVLSTMTE